MRVSLFTTRAIKIPTHLLFAFTNSVLWACKHESFEYSSDIGYNQHMTLEYKVSASRFV